MLHLPHEAPIPYQSPEQRELSVEPKDHFFLNPFNAQRLIFNIIKDYWIRNDPAAQGYSFEQRYSTNDADSGVSIDMAYNWKTNPIGKRPAVVVRRSDANYGSPVLDQMIGIDVKSSSKLGLHIVNMNCVIFCIATNVGFCEQIAQFTATPLIEYERNIRRDFKLRRFRMATIKEPSPYTESRDHFVSQLIIEVAFDSNQVIKGDDLKLKTIEYNWFLESIKPLANQ